MLSLGGAPLHTLARMIINSTSRWARAGALLAVTLLYGMIWGFSGIGKVLEGVPTWFPDKFGKTILATIPGLSATFWMLTFSEVIALGLALASLLRGEFLGGRLPIFLIWMLVWSLFIFIELSFGLWLTADYTGTAQEFVYFVGTLLALMFAGGADGNFNSQKRDSQ